ncbi:hypothetical protein [Schaedlerella arabinosiphila]|uniref:hypothetical protein n=1 Tax=Schaedlerella arabinosiphila TaxID=2044587 RepID=UPI00138F4D27|nr:hypothetical protein [Schaedlerella arabinosiphila]
MDADANHSGHERVMLFCMDHHAVQARGMKDGWMKRWIKKGMVFKPSKNGGLKAFA